MTENGPENPEEVADDWKIEFDEYQEKFYQYRLKFFVRGALEAFRRIIDALPSLTPEQDACKIAISDNDLNRFINNITRAKVTENQDLSYNKVAVPDDIEYKDAFDKAAIQFGIKYFWNNLAVWKKEPFYMGSEVDRCVELPCNFTLYFDQPFEDFESQIDRHRAHALKLYNERKLQKYVFLTDFLRDADGRKLSMSKLSDKWEKCLKVYDLSRTTGYQKKDGTPNLTQIGTDAGLYSYAHQHHVVNRTKDYLREAERLTASAWNMTFPD